MGTAEDEQMLEIGRIEKAHGLKGEVVVSLISNVPGRLAPGVALSGAFSGPGATGRRTGRTGRADEALRLVIESTRPFQQRHLVQFDGIANREDAEALRGVVLRAPAVDDPEALFVHELVGCEVVDQTGVSRGQVVAVEANPASDLLVGDGGWLVPLRFVVGRQERRILIDAPDGLFE
jgi:16S rRNA processing protein RimM